MSTFDYAELAIDALELLREFGGACVLRAPAAAGYSATGTVAGTAVDYAGTAVMDSIRKPFREGESVLGGDAMATVSPKDFTVEPKAGWLFTEGSTFADAGRWRVVDVRVTRPGGTTVIYDLHLRRA